eukprot:g26773.t1
MHPNRVAESDYQVATNVYNSQPDGYSNAYNNACSMAGLPGSYNVNMSMNMNVSMNMNLNMNSGAGVIRVPAHRPIPPPPLSAGMPTVPCLPSMGNMANLSNLTFPWMESSRRFAKDRLT